MPALLHTAAWKLGERAPRVPGPVAARLAAARSEAIEELARRAQQVERVVITGDLLADNQVDAGTLAEARRLLAAFAPVPVHVLPGARDPVETGCALARLGAGEGALSHVLVHLDAEPLQAGSFWLQPCPPGQRRPLRDPTEGIGAPPPGLIGVVLAHGRAGRTPVDEDVLHHVDAARLRDLGWRYVALGGKDDLFEVEGGVAYAGAPEVVGPGRNAVGGALIVELDAAATALRRVQCGARSWLRHQVVLRDDESLETLRELLEAVVEGPRAVVEVELRGTLSPHGHRRLKALLEVAASRLGHLEIDADLDVRLGEADLGGASGVLGDTLAALLATGDPVGRQAAMALLHAVEAP